MRIMIVDDSLTMRRIITMNLKKAGYGDLIEAENGKDAIDKLSSLPTNSRPELILLDWNMPEMTGLELLQILKKNPEFKNIPVIMVTSESEKDRVVLALQNGAAGYLVKPFTPETFEKQIIGRFKQN